MKKNMKKLYSIVILFGILVLISSYVFASERIERENKERENAFKSALNSYMETFMTEETPEEDKIVSYEYSGFGMSGESDDKLSVSISFNATPVNEENSTWSKYNNICFASFLKVNNEYVLDKISRIPDNYDKFLERFEEYKSGSQDDSNIEKVAIKSEEQVSLESQEVQRMSNNLLIGFAVLFVVSSVALFYFVKKRKLV